jgi:tRNA A-37 threonylcarbamoyl transferase component Bud32/CheY-like chemotaxis protein
MADLEAQDVVQQAVLLGLIRQEQATEAVSEAEDGSMDAISRALLRKGMLTSWQLERLKKGDPSGFFFGDCKVLFHLAEGTFARVYRGMRVFGDQPVAVKVLRQRFFTDPGAIERFKKEAENGMKLRHPNIVQILDYGERDRRCFMIMEYVEGSNLRDILKIRQRFSPEAALSMMLGLAEGLKYSHERGVTHRDIKATNILIGSNGVAKLVDFGLATIESEDKKESAIANVRTVDYSALERSCGSPKGDPRSDIYFLGCVYYQILTGKPAMMETESKDMLQKMLKRSFGAIKPISEHQHAPDAELCRIIEKMMTIDLKARYQTVDEVITDLLAYADRGKEGPGAKDRESDDEDVSIDQMEHGSIFFRPGEDRTAAAESAAPAPKKVLCVEKQGEIQDALRKTLSKMGYRVFLVGDPERAAERYRESLPDAVLFDMDGLDHDALDAFIEMHDTAHDDGHDLAAIVLLGPKQRTLQEKLPTDDRLVVLAKPIKMKQVQDAISQLVPLG